MSSAGQILGGLVGGIAGFLIPGVGPWIGAQVGMTLGGLLDPPRQKLPMIEGPRINDLGVQISTYGSPIPRVYGACAVSGNVLWVENNALRETVTVSEQKVGGGKGGKKKQKQKVRSYTYSATFAVALCWCPDRQVEAIGRIWIGTDLVVDANGAKSQFCPTITVYQGWDWQNPDPRMQATLGVDIPAWRGLCYLVIEDLPLARYGNSLAGAQVRAEILNSFVQDGGGQGTGIRLDKLIEREVRLSGAIGFGDLDFTGCTDLVPGYRVASVGTIRSALEPLRLAYPFDVVQSGYQLRFVRRGAASPVVTITPDDLDARGPTDEPGVGLTAIRETAVALPRSVTVQHLDYDREYNPGQQYVSRLRVTTACDQVVELPIVMTAGEALQKAETLLYATWLEDRYELRFILGPDFLALEPADLVELVSDFGTQIVRLTAVDYLSDGRLEIQARYHRTTVYGPVSTTPGSAQTNGPVTVQPIGRTVYQLLDVPFLTSAQDSESLLVAMCGELPGWQGGGVIQSTDGGTTWATVYDGGPPGPAMGTCSTALSGADSRQRDKAGQLTVDLVNGALYSVSEAELDAGLNLFAYGVHGRWEILSARWCTLISGATYLLEDLIRGRYGTEEAAGQHQVGDWLVQLDPTVNGLFYLPVTALGPTWLYRGITVGRDISTDSDLALSYGAVNLRPLSPVYLTGHRDASNDWQLRWVRRTRFGGEWRDFVDASLGETTERYRITVYADGTYVTRKRDIFTTTPSAGYSATDQTTDFGSAQSTLYLDVCQWSDEVGPGFALRQSITR